MGTLDELNLLSSNTQCKITSLMLVQSLYYNSLKLYLSQRTLSKCQMIHSKYHYTHTNCMLIFFLDLKFSSILCIWWAHFCKKDFFFLRIHAKLKVFFFTYKMSSLVFRRYTYIHQYIKCIPGNGMNKYERKVHEIVS